MCFINVFILVLFFNPCHPAKAFDAAKFFDTHPAFLDRAYSRPKMDSLKNGNFAMDAEDLQVNLVAFLFLLFMVFNLIVESKTGVS